MAKSSKTLVRQTTKKAGLKNRFTKTNYFFSYVYITNSLFLFNTVIYILIVLWGLILYIIGQTILSFDVKSNINLKSYKFECRSIGNDHGLLIFVQNLKKELER
jgi:hypothetical protein